MAATTTLLGLVTPTQGTLTGTWGDTVNYGISDYVDISVAGTLTLTNDGAVTLANTTGSSAGSNITSTLTGAGTVTAQFAIVRVTGTLTVAKVVTGPSYSKTYTVVNAATGGIVTFKASGQTGVSVAVGESAFVYFNGTDYVKVAGTAAVSSFSAGTTGLTPNTATTGAVTLAGTLAVANGGTGLTAGTSGGVLAYTATGTLASSTALAASALVIGGGAGAAPSTTTTGTGVVTALGVNTGSAGAFVVNGGALGTPSSGTVTNLTGTASININGTVGATTANTGAFTTLSASGKITSTAISEFLLNSSAAANPSYMHLANTSGDMYFGLNGAVATDFFSNGTAYDTTLAFTGAYAIGVSGGAQVARFTSTGLNSTVIGATTPAAGSFTTVSATDTISAAAAYSTATTIAQKFTNTSAVAANNEIKTQYAFKSTAYTNVIGAEVGLVTTTASADTYWGRASWIYRVNDTSGPTGMTEIVRMSSTGLAVTGALSASGNILTGTTVFGGNIEAGVTENTAYDATSTTGQAANGATLTAWNLSTAANTFSQVLLGVRGSGPAVVRLVAKEEGSNGSSFHIVTEVGAVPAERFSISATGTTVVTNLLDLSAATAGQIQFPATQNASSNANTLDDYDEYTATSAACTGAITTAVVWKLTKVGNVVTLTLPAVTGTASAAAYFAFGTSLPAKYRPTTNVSSMAFTYNNGADTGFPGLAYAMATGEIRIYKSVDLTAVFTNGAAGGLGITTSVSWTI